MRMGLIPDCRCNSMAAVRPAGPAPMMIALLSVTNLHRVDEELLLHVIDPQVDLERAKVVNDLLLTGLIHGLSLVERSGLPQNMSNATGDALKTDGSMAVVGF